ncbi:uncharacterized protein LOC136091687 [Hydra vulgaris]|uniref:Uncharacterized protein LOC136091687 n=1 Tax=Hydra vulgaris TaxID=6087 RepID=A0ABM4DLN8_HYDVU
MSFLKIEDPEKRDKIVKDYLDTKRRLKQNDLDERMGETNLQSGLEKLYKTLIDSQDSIKENIYKLQDQSDKLALNFSNYYPEAKREIMITETKKLLPSHEESKDTTFGIRDKDGIFYIGKKPIHINDNDIIIDGEKYYGTPGLWELIVKFNPNKGVYNAITSENPYKPKSSRSGKYREIIAPIWKDIKENRKRESRANGIGGRIQTIILPSNSKSLAEKLNLCIAAWRAGNTGARNEGVAICDELLRQGEMDSSQYKAIQNLL